MKSLRRASFAGFTLFAIIYIILVYYNNNDQWTRHESDHLAGHSNQPHHQWLQNVHVTRPYSSEDNARGADLGIELADNDESIHSNVHELYNLNTVKRCQLPHLTLENDKIHHAFYDIGQLHCNDTPNIFMWDNNAMIKVNSSALGQYSIQRCKFNSIARVDDYHHEYTGGVHKQKNNTFVTEHDYVKVFCHLSRPPTSQATTEEGRTIKYEQFMAKVHRKTEYQRNNVVPLKQPMSILVLVIDSLSHMSARRKLPRLYKYLQEDLASVVMDGYNIVGDGTTAAVVPILTGKTLAELPDVRKESNTSKYLDDFPFIWKTAKNRGYVTMFAEDDHFMNAFNLRLNGFKEQPTDHYMRTFWLAADRSHSNQISARHCLGGKPYHKVTLDYAESLFTAYPNVPKFGIAFWSKITHNDNNFVQYIEEDMVGMLKRLQDSGKLDNTAVVFMGDHGARYSKVRATPQGKLEERLPMMSLSFPKGFRQRYPRLISNLKRNANRLTSPFDLHKTLKAIINTKSEASSEQRGISLLQEISENRSCSDADIAFHWCTCQGSMHEQSTDSSQVQKAAHIAVEHMNNLTRPIRKLCRVLNLGEVQRATVAHTEKVIYYQLVILTLPNNGLYEATVEFDASTDVATVYEDISRVNAYGNQPDCIVEDYPGLRKFCLCKE